MEERSQRLGSRLKSKAGFEREAFSDFCTYFCMMRLMEWMKPSCGNDSASVVVKRLSLIGRIEYQGESGIADSKVFQPF